MGGKKHPEESTCKIQQNFLWKGKSIRNLSIIDMDTIADAVFAEAVSETPT